MYNDIKLEADLVEFEEDEIDEDSYKSVHETTQALIKAKEMQHQVRILKKFMKNLHKEIEDGTVLFKRVAPSRKRSSFKRAHHEQFSPKSQIDSHYINSNNTFSQQDYGDEQSNNLGESRQMIIQVPELNLRPTRTESGEETANFRPTQNLAQQDQQNIDSQR